MVTIALAALEVLVPFLKKGAETIAEEANKKIYDWISNKLTEKNKQKDLEEFQKKPDDERLKGKVEATLEDILINNPSYENELKKLIESAKTEFNTTTYNK